MKTRRGKRSEAFWPAIVMKKWLNITPRVNDFSEDEVETETEMESEDDACSLRDEKLDGGVGEDDMDRTIGNQSICRSQISETPPKGYQVRHRRVKSETMRVQYINTKDVRVTIATWNVAGRVPSNDLQIDDWLCTGEPADVYIIGFQEVVPLNAGNVLGAEDSTPIRKWEAIIRRTLNKSLEPESKHKCCSAPPSPVLRTSSVADVLADEIDDLPVEIIPDEYLESANGHEFEREGAHKVGGIGKNLWLQRIYGIDSDSRLDWPEYSLDANPQIVSSNSKLRRVVSSSARIAFALTENPVPYGPLNLPFQGNILKKSHHSSGDLQSLWMDEQHEPEVVDSFSDVSDGFSDEEDDILVELPMENYENEVENNRLKSQPKYVRIVSKQMVGIYISVWVRKRLRRHINNLKVSPVGVGLMGYMGNKGSVSVSMSLFQSRLCFVCSHLTSGQKDGAEQRRNADVNEIIRRTRFSSVLDEADQPQTIQCHDQIFWFGDLNYRLNMLDVEVRRLVALRRWDELINNDQLTNELRSGHVFSGWKEGVIDFPPTYKYDINSDRYVGENPKEEEKKRSPAWCDRILWQGRGMRQLTYQRAELKLSDHRPVSSVFLVEVVLDHRKLQRALNASTAAIHPEVFLLELWCESCISCSK